MLCEQVKELMKALEDAERARMELEDEYARVRAELLEELALVKAERDAFREKCEVQQHPESVPLTCFGGNENSNAVLRQQVLQSELVSTQRALANEKRERQVENEVASALASSLENLVSEKDQDIEKLHGDIDEMKSQMHYWQEQAKKAAEDSRIATERRLEAEKQRDAAVQERDKALMLAEIRYQEMLVESEARSRMEKQRDTHKTEHTAMSLTREKLESDNQWLMCEVKRMEAECAKRLQQAERDTKIRIAEAENVAKQAEQLLKRYALRDYYMSKRCKKLESDSIRLWQALQDCTCPAKRYKDKTSVAGGWSVYDQDFLAFHLMPDVDSNPRELQERREAFLTSKTGDTNEDGLDPWVTPKDRLRALVQQDANKRKTAFEAFCEKYQTARERAVKLKETEWERFWMNLEHTGAETSCRVWNVQL